MRTQSNEWIIDFGIFDSFIHSFINWFTDCLLIVLLISIHDLVLPKATLPPIFFFSLPPPPPLISFPISKPFDLSSPHKGGGELNNIQAWFKMTWVNGLIVKMDIGQYPLNHFENGWNQPNHFEIDLASTEPWGRWTLANWRILELSRVNSSRVLRDSTPHYVGWSLGWLVDWLVGQSVPFWAAAQKGSMTYAFTQGNFLLLLLLLLLLCTNPPSHLWANISALRLKSLSWGPNPNLKAQIVS